MSDKYEIIAQNCLALAIDRCETVGLPLKVKRQRMIIKGAIRQMLEEERLVEKLEAAKLLESLTPGGSEFSGSPEACAAWVRERLANTGKLAAERNVLREQIEALQKLSAARLVLLWNIEDAINNPDTSDEEKWQSIRQWLDEQRELTLATGEDEDTLVAQKETTE